MSFSKSVESIIQEAMERGEFDNLKGKGKPLDLTAYFEAPEDVRMAHSVLKNAGMVSGEDELLQEIASLKERLAATYEESQRRKIKKIIDDGTAGTPSQGNVGATLVTRAKRHGLPRPVALTR